jgi:hypothetical protein
VSTLDVERSMGLVVGICHQTDANGEDLSICSTDELPEDINMAHTTKMV